MVFWHGRRPIEYGSASSSRGFGSALTPEQREARTPRFGGRRALAPDRIGISFHAEAATDDGWLAAIAGLFRELAATLRPFFAGSYFRGPKGFEAIASRHWLGVPPWPLWLTWAGEAYLELLPAELPGTVERSVDHAFVRATARPLEELARNAIAWDANYVRSGGSRDEELAAAVIPALA